MALDISCGERKVSIGDEPRESISNGFNIVVIYHRFSGIVYLGYGRCPSRLLKVVLIIWALFVWSLTFVLNTPCLIHCFFEKNNHVNQTGFVVFNTLFICFTINNIFTAFTISRRGQRIYKLIKSLNNLVINDKTLRKQKILAILLVTYSAGMALMKVILINANNNEFSYHNLFRAMEDWFSESMADTIIILLIYLSTYVSTIIEELNNGLKDQLKNNEIDFEGIHKTICKLHKIVKKANIILSPCLILVFVLNISFVVAFAYLYQNLIDEDFREHTYIMIPLLSLYSMRLFFCCLAVDRMNVKV